MDPGISLTVVGSVNLDLVARVKRLPRAGETVSGASFERIPGGKGANQAVAAARLGAKVTFVGAVGRDGFADEAIANLGELWEVRLERVSAPTGVALILVDAEGENQIAVAPGANALVDAGTLAATPAVLCQLEVPDRAIERARERAGFLCVNAAPARALTVEPDLLVVNRYEHEMVD